MPYCPECGTKIISDDQYCSACGHEIAAIGSAPQSPQTESEATAETQPSTETADSVIEQLKPVSKKTAVSGIFFGVLVGFLFAWGLVEVELSGVGFVAGAALSTPYIWNRPTTHHSIASGLYLSAGVFVLVPIMFYIPVIAGAETETLEGAGEQIGGILGLFIWTVVFFIIAVVIAAIGRAIKGRAPDTAA